MSDDRHNESLPPPSTFFGVDYGSEPAQTAIAVLDERRRVVHIVSGTPSTVLAEWRRLAREDKRPS